MTYRPVWIRFKQCYVKDQSLYARTSNYYFVFTITSNELRNSTNGYIMNREIAVSRIIDIVDYIVDDDNGLFKRVSDIAGYGNLDYDEIGRAHV